MPNPSILRADVHPLATSTLLEYPLSEHAFSPSPLDGEKCSRCGRNRALHTESDTVSTSRTPNSYKMGRSCRQRQAGQLTENGSGKAAQGQR